MTLSADELRMVFAKNLNRLMENRKQIDVANDLGVSPSVLSSWCVGARMPRMDKIERLAQYFGVNKSDLLEDHSEPIPAYDAKTKKIMDMVSQMSEDQKDAMLRLFAPDNG